MSAEPETITAIALRPRSAVASPMPDRDEWQTMSSIANALAKARGFIPSHFQGDAYKVLAAIMYGRDLGLSPTVAIQHIIVIDGKATADAQLIGFLIRRAGHKLTDTTTATASTVKLTRADDGSVHEATFTIEMAARAGLVRDGGAWKKYPESMVYARALTMVARKGAQDALLGVVYTPEEMGAELGEDGHVDRLPVTQEFTGEIREVPTSSNGEIPTEQATPESRAAVEAAAAEPAPDVSPPAEPAAPSAAARPGRGIGPKPRRTNVVQVEQPPAPAGAQEEPAGTVGDAAPPAVEPPRTPAMTSAPPPEPEARVEHLEPGPVDMDDQFGGGMLIDPPDTAEYIARLNELRTLAAKLFRIRVAQRNRKAALNAEPEVPMPPEEPNEDADRQLAAYIHSTMTAETELNDLNDHELAALKDGLNAMLKQVGG